MPFVTCHLPVMTGKFSQVGAQCGFTVLPASLSWWAEKGEVSALHVPRRPLEGKKQTQEEQSPEPWWPQAQAPCPGLLGTAWGMTPLPWMEGVSGLCLGEGAAYHEAQPSPQSLDPEYWRSEISAFPVAQALWSRNSHEHHTLQKAIFTQKNEVLASTRLPCTQAGLPSSPHPHWPGALVSVASLKLELRPSAPPWYLSAVPGELLHSETQPCKASAPSSTPQVNCKGVESGKDLFHGSQHQGEAAPVLCCVGLWETKV